MSGGNTVALHEELSKALAAFHLGGGLGGAEDGILALLEFVNDTGYERDFRADDGEVGTDAVGDLEHGVYALHVAGEALGFVADAAIAGNAIELLHAGRLLQLPNQCVLAATAANDQDLHDASFTGSKQKGRVRGTVLSNLNL